MRVLEFEEIDAFGVGGACDGEIGLNRLQAPCWVCLCSEYEFFSMGSWGWALWDRDGVC